MFTRALLAAASFAALAFTPAAVSAVTVSEVGGNLDSFSWSVAGNVITLEEVWGAATESFIYLEFDGLVAGQNYIVNKSVTNNTGADWVNFGHELGFGTPNAFLSSDDFDGLSFAQGSGIPRTSTVFPGLLVDEVDDRDFLQFFGAKVTDGGVVEFSYGLRANNAGNNPFLLKQGPGIIPEPATWAMLIVGFGLVGFAARRRQAAVTA